MSFDSTLNIGARDAFSAHFQPRCRLVVVLRSASTALGASVARPFSSYSPLTVRRSVGRGKASASARPALPKVRFRGGGALFTRPRHRDRHTKEGGREYSKGTVGRDITTGSKNGKPSIHRSRPLDIFTRHRLNVSGFNVSNISAPFQNNRLFWARPVSIDHKSA